MDNNLINSAYYHLANNPAKYQPVRQNNFRCIVDFSNLELFKGGNPIDADSFISAEEAKKVIDFSVVKFNPPHFSQEEIPIKRGNSTIYFAGVPSFESDEMVINDFAGADGKSILMAWQALSYDITTDTIPSSDNYKTTATVFEFLPDGTYIRHWILEGCWVTKINEDGWDNESGNKKTVSATIRYDRALPQKDQTPLPINY